MADKFKYKKGDTIFNLGGKHIGTIVKVERHDYGSKYEIEMLDGSPNIVLDDHYIHEAEYHKIRRKRTNNESI